MTLQNTATHGLDGWRDQLEKESQSRADIRRREKENLEDALRKEEDYVKRLQEDLDERTRELAKIQRDKQETIARLSSQRKDTFAMHGFYYDLPNRQEKLAESYMVLYDEAKKLLRMTLDTMRFKNDDPEVYNVRNSVARVIHITLKNAFLFAKSERDDFESSIVSKMSNVLETENTPQLGSLSSAQKQVMLDLLRHSVFLSNSSKQSSVDAPEIDKDAEIIESDPPEKFAKDAKEELLANIQTTKQWKEVVAAQKSHPRKKPVLHEKERFVFLVSEFVNKCVAFAWNLLLCPEHLAVEQKVLPARQDGRGQHTLDVQFWPTLKHQQSGTIFVPLQKMW